LNRYFGKLDLSCSFPLLTKKNSLKIFFELSNKESTASFIRKNTRLRVPCNTVEKSHLTETSVLASYVITQTVFLPIINPLPTAIIEEFRLLQKYR